MTWYCDFIVDIAIAHITNIALHALQHVYMSKRAHVATEEQTIILRFATLSESAKTIALVWFNFFNKIGFASNRNIIVCISMMTSVCITSEHRTITHSDARFNTNSNLSNVV